MLEVVRGSIHLVSSFGALNGRSWVCKMSRAVVHLQWLCQPGLARLTMLAAVCEPCRPILYCCPCWRSRVPKVILSALLSHVLQGCKRASGPSDLLHWPSRSRRANESHDADHKPFMPREALLRRAGGPEEFLAMRGAFAASLAAVSVTG